VFRSDAQLARVCRAFCARARLGRLWTEAGPTDEAMALLQNDGGALSSGERMVILVAWSLWNGQGHVMVADAIHRLDGMSLAMLGKLMVAGARGSDAVEAWLAEQENRRRGVGHA
jgi:hypothetical protein